MLMKRHYNLDAPKDDWTQDKEGNLIPPLSYIEIKHTGSSNKQNLSTRLVSTGIKEGWLHLDLDKKEIRLNARPETLLYHIYREPGRYCCHCNLKLPDDVSGELARLHVQSNHENETSPDPESPSGYCKVNAYLCTLNEDQHKRWSLSRDEKGHLWQDGKRWKGEKQIG